MRLIGLAGYVAVVLGAVAPATARQPSTDERSFGTAMASELQRKLPDGKVTAVRDDPLSARIRGGEWADATVNFHRIYGYCRNATPADCATAKMEFLDKILKKAPEATAASLRIAVRDKEYGQQRCVSPNLYRFRDGRWVIARKP